MLWRISLSKTLKLNAAAMSELQLWTNKQTDVSSTPSPISVGEVNNLYLLFHLILSKYTKSAHLPHAPHSYSAYPLGCFIILLL